VVQGILAVIVVTEALRTRSLPPGEQFDDEELAEAERGEPTEPQGALA